MPTYDYRCEACGHEFEREQRMSEDPIKKCPKCGKSKAKRQITGGNFILKGSGWYADLYHKPSGKKESKDEGGGAETKAESKPEAKPEAKAEAKSEGKPAKAEGKAKKKD